MSEGKGKDKGQSKGATPKTIADVAVLLGVTPETVRRRCEAGLYPHSRAGRRITFTGADVRRILSSGALRPELPECEKGTAPERCPHRLEDGGVSLGSMTLLRRKLVRDGWVVGVGACVLCGRLVRVVYTPGTKTGPVSHIRMPWMDRDIPVVKEAGGLIGPVDVAKAIGWPTHTTALRLMELGIVPEAVLDGDEGKPVLLYRPGQTPNRLRRPKRPNGARGVVATDGVEEGAV